MAVMSDLQEGILTRLKSKGLDVRQFAFKDLIDGTINLTRPAVNIVINSATAKKISMTAYSQVLTVSVILVVQELKGGTTGEGKRRSRTYDLIEALTDDLAIQNFGLPLENPMFPLGFNNLTNQQQAAVGIMMFEIRFWCSYLIRKQDDSADYGTLANVLLDYTLEPVDPAAQPPQAEDNLTLSI